MEKLTEEEYWKQLRTNLNENYNAMVEVAALYKKIYGHFPKIGLSGQQGAFADSLIPRLPDIK